MNAFQEQVRYSVEQVIRDHLDQDSDRDNAIREASMEIVQSIMSKGSTAQSIIDKVVECGRKGFITSESCGPEGRYEVVASFRTLAESQSYYSALSDLSSQSSRH
jgi:hypothetical protein